MADDVKWIECAADGCIQTFQPKRPSNIFCSPKCCNRTAVAVRRERARLAGMSWRDTTRTGRRTTGMPGTCSSGNPAVDVSVSERESAIRLVKRLVPPDETGGLLQMLGLHV